MSADKHDVRELIQLLDLQTLGENRFQGDSRDLGARAVYGGQVVSQAMVAATRTVEGRDAHSLHAYFLRPGDAKVPIVYEVENVRDGRSFSARRVTALQNGKPILTLMASFQKPEHSVWEHQATMPQVPPPEELENDRTQRLRYLESLPNPTPRQREALTSEMLFDRRYVKPLDVFTGQPQAPQVMMWVKAAGSVPDDPALHRNLLAYVSDFGPLMTSVLPHGKPFASPDMVLASIDHAVWFHREARVDDWLLYVIDSSSSQSWRGSSFGKIFDRQGRLVATTAQEGLARLIDTAD